MGWRAPVEMSGFILKPEETASYKIIYSYEIAGSPATR
jgi:hypothetical protein